MDAQRPAHHAQPIGVTIVNDYELVVKGLRAMLAEYPERVDIVDVEIGGIPDRPCEIALFDTQDSDPGSIDRVRELVDDATVGRVVLYTWDRNEDFTTLAMRHGVEHVISKTVSGDQLVELLEDINSGDPTLLGDDSAQRAVRSLTARETQVLALIAKGHTNRMVADELCIGVETVRTHVRNILAKLDVHNRTEATLAARTAGLI